MLMVLAELFEGKNKRWKVIEENKLKVALEESLNDKN